MMRRPKSLKNALLGAVGLLVLAGCVFTALLATYRYAESIEDTLSAQNQVLAQSLASQLTDFVLTNDVTSIQKSMDRLVGNHDLAYGFVLKENEIIVHTFDKGVPEGLLHFNTPEMFNTMPNEVQACSSRKFTFKEQGGVFLDVACPIFEGKGGILRIGVSEKIVKTRVFQLWLETGLVTLGVLIVALGGVVWLLKSLTRPLESLVDAIEQVGAGHFDVRVPMPAADTPGQREILSLAQAFNSMSQKLEEKTKAVARSHDQLKTCNAIVSGMASRNSLQAMGEFLLSQCRDILHCADIAVLFFDSELHSAMGISPDGIVTITEQPVLQQIMQVALQTEGERTRQRLAPPLVPARFTAYEAQVHIAMQHEGQTCGLVVLGCSPGCHCNKGDIALLNLVLGQATGSIHRALEHEREVRHLRQRFEQADSFCGIVSRDARMRRIFKLIEDVAPSDATILIQSESGTGKELVANAVHHLSTRQDKPFVVINCAAYPDTLLESELFGYEKGAFTGAGRQRVGRFEQANGGTVFLDEIGEISPSAQVKLLRVLQTRTIERLGGSASVPVNVRIIAATNRDLLDEIKAGRFREDLYYRLDVVSIKIPPLRERAGDIVGLVRYFLSRFAREHGAAIPSVSPTAMQILMEYSWPGNVRELENSMEQAIILARDGVITPAELPLRLHAEGGAAQTQMEEAERVAVLKALENAQWNKKLAAERLGISRTTLYAKMKHFGLSAPSS